MLQTIYVIHLDMVLKACFHIWIDGVVRKEGKPGVGTVLYTEGFIDRLQELLYCGRAIKADHLYTHKINSK